MRKIIYLSMLCFFAFWCKNVMSQETTAPDIGKQYFELGEYFRWGLGFEYKPDYKKAMDSYQRSASLGNPDGIMALGEIYLEGLGVIEIDKKKAYALFLEAYEKGSGRACYNMGRVHAYGLGCEMDYEKMIAYLKEGINRGDNASMYAMGDMYYKGWGVEQSYEKAVSFFEQAASLGSESGRYCLGVCYRNGYGVARDEKKAMELLKQASKLNYFSKKELKLNEPEIEKGKKIKSKDYDSPSKHLKTEHAIDSKNLPGKWSGDVTIYDWSGQYKLEQIPIELNFDVEGELFTATGTCGSEKITLKGFNNNLGIEFSSGEFKYTDHFNGTVTLKINSGTFKTYAQGQREILAGSISLFSVTENEPGRPAYLVITREKEKEKEPNSKSAFVTDPPLVNNQPVNNEEAVVTNTDTKNNQEQLDNEQSTASSNTAVSTEQNMSLTDHLKNNYIQSKVWPLPFTNTLNVEYNLIAESNVQIRLITVNGKFVKTLFLGEKTKGTHKQQFNISAAPGVYLIQILAEKQNSTHRVIKQ